MKDVYDLAGNLWWHEYGPSGRLATAFGANGRPYLHVRYDALGRTVASQFGREYSFAYAHRATTVTEGTGQVRVFGQDAAGMTVRMVGNDGVNWEVFPDASGRVMRLKTPARTVEYSYANGKAVRIVETTASARREQEYAYDGAGRLSTYKSTAGDWTHVAYASGHVSLEGTAGRFAYGLSPSGAVTSVQDAAGRIDAEYDRHGDLVALRRGGLAVEFTRGEFGRLLETRHASGVVNRYFYDALGNRNGVDFGFGGQVRYRHDAAGNIVSVEVTELDGNASRQSTRVGDHNRIEAIAYEGGGSLDVEYDRMGNPVRFKTDDSVVTAEYAPNGALRRLESSSGKAWSPNGADGRGADAERFEDRLDVLTGDASGAAQPAYGPLTFADLTFAPVPADLLEAGVPGLAAARSLHRLATALLQDRYEAMYAFEKPSNPAFQAPEYRTTNCCIPCPSALLCGSCQSFTGYGGENCYCATLCYVFLPPFPSRAPAVEQVRLLGGGATWGRNVNIGYQDTLTCSQVCGEQYYLTGDIFPSSSWRVQVTTHVQGPNRCTAVRRTPWNIARTEAHENRHAAFYLGHINAAKRRVNIAYGTLAECETAKMSITVDLTRQLEREKSKQMSHVDFRGEQKYTALCADVSREVPCGEHVDCPDGNTY